MKLKDIIKTLRPSQWTKNAIVLAAFFFAFWDPSQKPELWPSLFLVVPAAILFCLVSSGIYILNDIKDVTEDRNHPLKKHRPIAAGRIAVPAAWGMALFLLSVGCACSLLLSFRFAIVVASYVAIQIIYSFGLKQIALVDIIVIAVGFVLRAIAGAVVLNVNISPWLLLCTFLLALFLALCKRRHEKVLLNDARHRVSLGKYDERLLDQLISIASSSTIVSYAMYTLSRDTVDKFGTTNMAFSIPFVLFGIFRYLDLVYRHKKGDRPEKILLTDIPLLADLILYGITLILVFHFRT